MPLGDGLRLVVAEGRGARLAGLAGMRSLDPRTGLLIPRCRSVHTIGMRFGLDLIWLGDDGGVVDLTASVRPGRVVSRRHARAVIEVRAGAGAVFFTGLLGRPTA